MFYGNLCAIPQRNIKRMLAYSSIAQVGYIMIGVLAAVPLFSSGANSLFGRYPTAVVSADAGLFGIPWEMQGVLIYVMAYLLMNLGAFAVVVAVGKKIGSDNIESYAGLMKHSPLYAAALGVFLISLAGIPPTAGFLGKLFIFGSAIRTGAACAELLVLAVVGIVNSTISAYYYLNVVRYMFIVPAAEKHVVRGGLAVNMAIVVALVLTLGLLVFAKPVSDLAAQSLYRSGVTGVR